MPEISTNLLTGKSSFGRTRISTFAAEWQQKLAEFDAPAK